MAPGEAEGTLYQENNELRERKMHGEHKVC